MQQHSSPTTSATDPSPSDIIEFPAELEKVRESPTPVNARPLHHEVLVTLRDLIVHNELAPGRRLNERLLCERLKVSRTPLREALKVLSHEGLVELLPNRGARVVELTREDVRHLFEILSALESLAGRLACQRITEAEICEIKAIHYHMQAQFIRRDLPDYFRDNQEIHKRIVAAARNPVLATMYENLNSRLLRARYLASQTDRDRWTAAMREHELIINALERRQADELAELLQQHLNHKYESLCRHL
ncbi:MAG TPA: GntR family transcriptional regulator [Chthoniobacterales bacterium]|nr:GntR family transcriptional regulator [Chthoniobacterales bacterium]